MHKRLLYLIILLAIPNMGFGMHIAEGFLPVNWAVLWWVVFVPFLYIGLRDVKKHVALKPQAKMLFSVVAAFVFVLSSLKLPSVAGSSSHLTGIALGAILFGASTMSVIGFIALLFQALLLAHGGLTTLGANAFSMAVCGAFVAVWIFKFLKKLSVPQWLTIFCAAFFSNLVIYTCTSIQLAIAFQTDSMSFSDNLIKFLSIYAITQLPLSVIEGLFTVFAFRLLKNQSLTEIIPFIK